MWCQTVFSLKLWRKPFLNMKIIIKHTFATDNNPIRKRAWLLAMLIVWLHYTKYSDRDIYFFIVDKGMHLYVLFPWVHKQNIQNVTVFKIYVGFWRSVKFISLFFKAGNVRMATLSVSGREQCYFNARGHLWWLLTYETQTN